MLATYAITIFLCVASVALGEAILRACGYRAWSHLAPATGLAALVVLAPAVFWLPGRHITAAVIIALVTALALVVIVRRAPIPGFATMATFLLVLGAVSVPFLVNRHTGIFGVTIDDDFAAHFTWASSLFESVPGTYLYPNYPLGPHTLAASLAGLFATSVEAPFTAFLLAVPILTALTAQAALKELTMPARVLGGALVGLPYLVAGHIGETSFKELMMGLILVGFALTLRELQRQDDWRPRLAVVPGIMLAAPLLIYGANGIVWPAAAAVLWALAELVRARAIPSREIVRGAGAFVGVALACALIGCLSELSRLLHFSGAIPGGNVPTYTSPFQLLGVWFSGDFRTSPTNVFQTGLLVGGALAIAVYGLVWWTRRRDFSVPAAALGGILIYIAVRHKTGPYLTSKPLVVAAPVVMLTLTVPVLHAWGRRMTLDLRRFATAAVAVVFVAGAAWSSLFALRYIRVESNEHAAELSAFRAQTRGMPTLDIVPDPFALWELRGADLSSPTPYSSTPVVPFTLREPYEAGQSLDVDSVVPADLNSFRYIVTTSSQFASQMPSNWRLEASTRSYDLWKRTGPSPAREVLASINAPGALLDCHTPDGRRLIRSNGTAAVWNPAPVGPDDAWTLGSTPLTPTPQGFVAVTTGSVLKQVLTLPRGRWEISLPYQSPAHLYVTAANMSAIAPPNLSPLGTYWRIGELTSTGAPILFTVRLQEMRFDAAAQVAAISGLAAVRLPRRIETVPLRQSCGRYVDWYTG